MLFQQTARGPMRLAFAWAFVLCALILWAVYPGFMSYDSLHALREAREGVRGGPYPPFVSYVWRVLDWVFPGPAAMLFVQNLVLALALAAFFALSSFGRVGSVIGLTLVVLAPPLLGPMIVVWKDVALSASFAAAAAIMYWMEIDAQRERLRWLAAAALLVLCGMAFRMNAAPAALPLLIWLASIAARGSRGGVSGAIIAAVNGAVLFAGLAAIVILINSHRFPDLVRLEPNPQIASMQYFDLVGVTAKAGAVVVPLPGVADAKRFAHAAREAYDPRHLNLTRMADDASGAVLVESLGEVPADALGSVWWRTISARPDAYLAHRWAIFRELIGFTDREVFYPTHGGVDPNEFGYAHTPNWASERIVGYVEASCGPAGDGSLSCRSWVYHLAGLVAAIAVLAFGRRFQRTTVYAVYGSGLAYLLPQFFIAPAAEHRYTQWSVVASILTCVVALGLFFTRSHAGLHQRSEHEHLLARIEEL